MQEMTTATQPELKLIDIKQTAIIPAPARPREGTGEEAPDKSAEAERDPGRHYRGPVSVDLHTAGRTSLRR